MLEVHDGKAGHAGKAEHDANGEIRLDNVQENKGASCLCMYNIKFETLPGSQAWIS